MIMNTDKAVDAWYAVNTDALDTEMMNAILTNLAFALIEEEILDDIRIDTGPELDDDTYALSWNGTELVYKSVEAWYAANTDELDNEMMNTMFTNLAFALIEEEILDDISIDADPDEELELDDDFGEMYWNGNRLVDKQGDYA
jgi:hypothetical protein